MATITIDGKQVTVKDGITLIEAIDQVRSDLPRYCYHPGLSIAGNCRICQVEVEKMPRTVIACNTRVAEGMVVHTQSPKAKESQQVVLEFLLANHPLDCPVCDQAGECKLQDYYMDYGLYDSKFDEQKVKKTKKAQPIGPTVSLDQERCILCSRCVRFGDEITKTHDFGIFNRGDHAQVDIYPGKELNNPYSGNVVDICPVGALTDRDFRFKMRVWYLGKQKSVCPGCSRGCNISVEFEKSRPYHLKDERIMRLKPRENQEVNRWWMCDEGRYAYKSIDQNRIKEARIRENSVSRTVSLKEALDAAAGILRKSSPASWALLASAQRTNEELYLTRKIFQDLLKWKHAGFRASETNGAEDDFLMKKDKNPNSAGAAQILASSANEEIAGIVERAKKGEFEGLLIMHHDLAKIFGAETLKTIRQKTRFIVYEGTHHNATSEAADVVLPVATYAEKDGTFTNFQGRVQRIRKAVEPFPGTLPSWDLLMNLGALLGLELKYLRPENIFEDLAKENGAFSGMTYKLLGDSGAVWSKP